MPSPLDYVTACPPCGWCCKGERVYLSAYEARRLGFGYGAGTVPSRANGSCELLDEATGYCRAHALRPTECRLFPLDVLGHNGSPTWVLWDDACPVARSSIEGVAAHAEVLARWEEEMAKWEGIVTQEWVDGYTAHHRTPPPKYSARGYIALRPVEVKG